VSIQEKETSPEVASQPLEGTRIVVTRPLNQSIRFSECLTNLGSQVIQMPTVKISEPSDLQDLDRAVCCLPDFDWVVFTSSNAIHSFTESARRMGICLVESLSNTEVCCVGPETARISESYGMDVETVPMIHTGEAIVELFRSHGDLSGKKFLIPLGSQARPTVSEGLEGLGARVAVVLAYETLPVLKVPSETLTKVQTGVDLLTFTSPSTVQSFHDLVGGEVCAPAAVIGPVTAEQAEKLGYEVVAQATEYSTQGLLKSIVKYFVNNTKKI